MKDDITSCLLLGGKKVFKYVLLDMYKRIKDDDITAYAAQITYFLILSMFPFLIFFITILGRTSLIAQLEKLTFTSNFIPSEITSIIQQVLNEIYTFQSSDTFLSISLLITIYSASRGVRAIMKGMNKAYRTRETRSIIEKFLVSFVYTIGLAMLIIVALALLVFGNMLGSMLFDYLGIDWLYYKLWRTLRLIIPIALMLLVYLFIFRATPNIKLTFKQVFPGAFFSTLISICASSIFSFYVNNFADYSVVYGSIGSIIVLLLWLYIISTVLILGGELNASLKNYREKVRAD